MWQLTQKTIVEAMTKSLKYVSQTMSELVEAVRHTPGVETPGEPEKKGDYR